MKLSDKKPVSAFIQNRRDINKYVYSKEVNEISNKKKYDVALVLGSSIRDILFKRADEAIKLYKNGIIKKIFISGGIGFISIYRSESEANTMKEYMIFNGVKEDDIYTEEQSRNTYENMKYSVSDIEKLVGKTGSIVLITSDFHLRRSKGILNKMTKLKIYSYGVIDDIYNKDMWYRGSLKVKRLIRTEAMLLSSSVKKGIIDDIDIDKENK